MECWSIGGMEYWSNGVLECWSIGARSQFLEVAEHENSHFFEEP
jgi:hypothetical protein